MRDDGKAAIWARVSTDRQETDNQTAQLREVAARRGLEVVEVYEVEASAYTGKQRAALDAVYRDARAGRFSVLLVWALDRLTRQGIEAMLGVVRRFDAVGCRVVSFEESWTEASGPARDLMLAIVGWVAQMESARRSERTKAGLERARRQGKALGRPTGAKDKTRRKRSGYVARWERPEEREAARRRAVAAIGRVNNGRLETPPRASSDGPSAAG